MWPLIYPPKINALENLTRWMSTKIFVFFCCFGGCGDVGDKMYVGEDKNSNACWWSLFVKTFLYVGEVTNIQFHTYSPTYSFTNILIHQHSFFTNIRTSHWMIPLRVSSRISYVLIGLSHVFLSKKKNSSRRIGSRRLLTHKNKRFTKNVFYEYTG